MPDLMSPNFKKKIMIPSLVNGSLLQLQGWLPGETKKRPVGTSRNQSPPRWALGDRPTVPRCDAADRCVQRGHEDLAHRRQASWAGLFGMAWWGGPAQKIVHATFGDGANHCHGGDRQGCVGRPGRTPPHRKGEG